MNKAKELVELARRYLNDEPIVVKINGKRRRVNLVITFALWVISEIIRWLLAN